MYSPGPIPETLATDFCTIGEGKGPVGYAVDEPGLFQPGDAKDEVVLVNVCDQGVHATFLMTIDVELGDVCDMSGSAAYGAVEPCAYYWLREYGASDSLVVLDPARADDDRCTAIIDEASSRNSIY